MTPESQNPTPMSEGARLAGVFFEPKKTFADIGRRPRWWVPMVLLMVATIGYTYAISQHVGWERAIRKTLETNQRVQALTPEQREQAIERGAKFGAMIGYIGAAIGPPITILFLAAILMGTARMMGGQLRFEQVLAVNSYASLTGLVFVLLCVVVLFLKPPDDFNIQNPLAFNIGAFLDPSTTPKALFSVAGSIDLFTFWRIALLAVGLSAAARGFSFGKALAAVALPWLLLVVAKAGWAAAFG